VRLCSERSRCCGANLPYRERPLGWSVRLRPRGAHTSFLRGLYVGPRLLVTRQERSRKREPPGAEPARGLCAGDRDPGPSLRLRSGRSLARGSPHQPSGNPPGRDAESGARGSRCGTCSCVRVFCAVPAVDARAGLGGSGRGACVSSKWHAASLARPGPRTKPAPGLCAQRPLGASGDAPGWWCQY
jgi:hypothetical protein